MKRFDDYRGASSQTREKIEELEDSIEIMADKRMLASTRRGLQDVKAGRYKIYERAEDFVKDVFSHD